MPSSVSLLSPIDGVTGAVETVSYAHHEIHSGNSYTTIDSQAVDTTTIKWQVTTPDNTKWAHMLFNADCTGEMTVLVTEGSDRVDGTALAEINRNRNSTNIAGVIVTRTPTGGSTDGATVLFNTRVGATSVASKTIDSGTSRGNSEYVLKQNTKYVISVTTYAAVQVSLHLDWYEHTSKG